MTQLPTIVITALASALLLAMVGIIIFGLVKLFAADSDQQWRLD